MTREEFLSAAQERGDVWLPVSELPNTEGLVTYRGYATLPELADKEDVIARCAVLAVIKSEAIASEEKINALIREYEGKNGAALHEHQAEGVRMIVNNNLSILTGGPGTGKTTTINCAVYVCERLGCGKVVFAAPTGKASRQITRSTGREASTLHHILGLGYENQVAGMFKGDILFMDESSMNDLDLSYHLFNAVTAGKKVVWIGDTDQIPSVGIGAVLRDLIASRVIPCTMLTKTFRQKDGELLHNIKEVRKGSTDFWFGKQFEMEVLPPIKVNDLDEKILNSYLKEADTYGRDNVAVLLPYRTAGYCSDRVNAIIQSRTNAASAGLQFSDGKIFREGDPVMQLENKADCVNGEVGKVIKADAQRGVLTVCFGDDKYLEYTAGNINELTLAYAMSVTKSQGSEYASVILVQLDSHKQALNRNILYTGMSRAKQHCVLFTQSEALKASASTSANGRKTFLREKIRAVAGL